MSPEVLQLLNMACMAVGVYTGIRMDLAAMRVKIEHAQAEASRANDRIDQFERA